jgi:two-component system sensor histidine kinase/response regulator
VAEDHPLNRLVASIVLEEANLRFEFVEDGEQAVAAVKTGRFDLVLMDVHMPRMDGLEATRQIRQLEGPAGRIPIIAVTANASADEVAECREAGMDDVVPKPISALTLLQCILDHAPAARPDA